jgi:hypothetical protein
MRTRNLVGMIFVCIFFCSAFGQQTKSPASANVMVPRLIRFGGVLQSSESKALGRNVGITFALYKDNQGGAPLWIETQNVPLDATGRYNVLLGATKAEGVPIELFTTGQAQWLGVRVENQPEQSRVLLVSVPYALKAQEAETLAGKPVSQFVSTDTLKEQVRREVRAQVQPNAAIKVSSTPFIAATVSGATNFSDNTTDQVVGVQQNGTGVAISAAAPANNGIVSTTGSATGIAVYGKATSTAAGLSYGLRGDAVGPNGRGFEAWRREAQV